MYNMLFLATDPFADSAAAGAAASGLMGIIFALIAVLLVYAVFYWIFSSFAYMSIAKKAKQDSPGLAWIPFVGPAIIAFKSSKMHWWPWLLLIGCFIPIISSIAGLVFAVYVIIWNWKLFEEIGKPAWWSILLIIPIVNFVIMGIAAWKD